MKNTLAILAAGLMSLTVSAQSSIAPIGVMNGVVSQPQTTLYIDIMVERQEIISGPYARYAQKYLGVTAPLSDKVSYEIIAATVCDKSDCVKQDYAVVAPPTTTHMNPPKGFPKLPIDKLSNAQSTLEENAKRAADQIFKIRRSRYELITAEAGENVFGAGLQYALEELDHMEEEYLSLFLGKQSTSTTSKQYKVTPVPDKQNYIVCRFSSIDGLLPDDDLSGQPVVLDLKSLGSTSTEGLTVVEKPSKGDKPYRVAEETSCRLIFNNSEIASAVLPVFQLGKTVYLR